MAKFFSAILRRPSQRTLFEAQLTGMTVLLISTIFTPIYMIFFTDTSLAIKIFSSLGSIGIFLFLFANLSLTYIQYHTFKLQMGMYPKDYELELKIEEAKQIIEELNELVKDNVVQEV